MIERKWLITIVVISVALNLLLVGFYIGQQPLPGRTNLRIDPTMGLPRVLQGLPEDRRRALLQDVDVSRREIASRHRALQKVQIDIERAMAMEPFDAESLANALENFRRRFDENQEDSHRESEHYIRLEPNVIHVSFLPIRASHVICFGLLSIALAVDKGTFTTSTVCLPRKTRSVHRHPQGIL